MNLVLDTSVLIQNGDFLKSNIDNYSYIVSSVVAGELDNQKESDNPKRAFNGRVGLRFIENNEDKIRFVVGDICEGLPDGFDLDNNDNKIISCAIKENAKIATRDRGMKIKALACGVECIDINDSENLIYKGYTELILDLQDENDSLIIQSIYDGSYDTSNLHENEYVIMKDKNRPMYHPIADIIVDYETIDIKRHSNGEFF